MDFLPTIMDPNFSIITPGPCNMHCSFCFWKRDPEEVGPSAYLGRLKACLETIPPQFNKISITGGEPTISPIIVEVLEVIYRVNKARKNIQKVVFTTNGSNLDWLLHTRMFRDVVTNVNISMHSNYEHYNKSIFGDAGNNLPSQEIIKAFNKQLNKLGIPVCCNAVLNAFMPSPEEFVVHCRNLGFSEVTLRKPHTKTSDLSPTDYENEIIQAGYRTISHSECPVCRTDVRLIEGLRTFWSASIAEPTDVMVDEIYEVVFHPDGKLYADWSKNIEIEI